MSKSLKAVLETARERGYLFAPYQGRQALTDAWLVECWRAQRPFLFATRGFRYYPRTLQGCLYLELRGKIWLSRNLWQQITQEFEGTACPTRDGNRVTIDNLPHREIEQYAQRLLALVKQHAPTQEEAFDLPPEMKLGLARCTYNEAMKDRLEEDKTYYISEISNMMGRVVILESGQLPMVGYHLYRFELDPAG